VEWPGEDTRAFHIFGFSLCPDVNLLTRLRE
jgi:hypothetical protein